ncbi:carboxymuconolactone decarboxylase [Mycobacterium sp. IEC1808]|uniref:carboxymuconolactone decarboxylase family protein n=1 Tax=Mycobacterium sp. IEC1808 TaxID=1743230 RepID=UPI000A1672EE|nr:carboxymuconolactone decarboxylase family protein [Mycobacterium sp. IEC1808]ORW96637.1 carboxymuconolactone decarboxylase [Mycobacterium sp. IEC1808]
MRLPPLPADQWDEAVEQSLSGMLPPERRNPRDAGTLMSTLARHPKLARAYLRFGGYLLLDSSLPARIREQAILRVAHRCDCAYEWSHHVDIAKKVGLSEAEIAAAKTGETDDEFDRAVFAAVDELDEKSNVSDQTWTTLSERLDERQRMDFVFTVGGYIALAMAINTFGVQLENEKG